MYFFIILLTLFVLVFTIFQVITSIVFKRSLRASIVETYLHYTSKRKKHAKSRKKFDKYLRRHKNRSDLFIFPKIKLKSNINEYRKDNVQIYRMYKCDHPKLTIIYLHGGAYISQPLKYHWKFCDKLVQNLDAQILFPIYPLTPNHHWDESFELIKNIYFDLMEKTSLPIVLMGDSSGGGLALSFCEYLANYDLPQPQNLILLSPWLDVTLSHPQIYDYEKKDPMLAIEPLREIGLMWSSSLDPKDYRVSPLYGDASKICNMTLIVGTRELLYPEITQFYNNLKSENVHCQLYIGKGMNHDFPLYPIPEARKAQRFICDTIKKTCSNIEKVNTESSKQTIKS